MRLAATILLWLAVLLTLWAVAHVFAATWYQRRMQIKVTVDREVFYAAALLWGAAVAVHWMAG